VEVADSAASGSSARFVRNSPRGVCLVISPKPDPLKSDPFRFDGSKRIRCVLADDHTLLRDGVRRVLEEASDFAVVGEAADASEALKLVIEYRPDLVLLDISMPGMSSFESARLIEEHCAGTRIVFLTMHEDLEYLTQALRSGASGYLLKDTPAPHLLHALRSIHRGEQTFSPRIMRQMQEGGASGKSTRGRADRTTLTPREREVMKLLAEGHTVRQAAGQLGVSVKTVEAHKFNLMRKLDIHNKAQLVTVAIRKKIVSAPIPM
jgi:DNA-binding NarL/FixJ family response regulator